MMKHVLLVHTGGDLISAWSLTTSQIGFQALSVCLCVCCQCTIMTMWLLTEIRMQHKAISWQLVMLLTFGQTLKFVLKCFCLP